MKAVLEVVGVGTLDLFDDIPMSLNFSIADISEPDKRNASYSKTLKLPGTANNNKILGHLFEIDIYSSFNPNLKTEVNLYSDGIQVMSGYLRITDVLNNNEKIEYECTIIGNVGNIFSEIGDSYLTDFDFSALDHDLTYANITASWSNAIGVGYVYPMIDYGYNNGLDWQCTDFYPAIFLKRYIDEIFGAIGWSYTSTFFNSDFFKRLVIPYSGGSMRLSAATITLNYVSLSASANYNIIGAYSNLPFDTEVSDANNLWGAGYVFRPKITGLYNFNATVLCNVSSAFPEFRLLKYPVGGKTPVVLWQGTGIGNATITGVNASIPLKIQNHLIKAGEGVTLQARGAGAVFQSLSTMEVTMTNSDVKEGGGVDLSSTIPQKVKQKDLFLSVIKMFNLYVDIDKSNSRNLIIEPRDTFYTMGEVIDWTSKLDTSRGIKIKPIGDTNNKKYIYTYKEDKDYYNALYKGSYGEVYGTRTIDTVNDFVTGTKVLDVIFSPTPLVRANGNPRIISSISPTKITQSTSDKHDVNNIRILYWAGLITPPNKGDWNFVTFDSLTGAKTKYWQANFYPYAGHLDNPYTPTLDLCFGVPKEVAYETTTYTNNNVFNAYHKKFLEEIIDPNSKLVTAYLFLNPIDIYQLNFSNEFYIDGHLLRLNKISDYDAINDSPCKCEFIKIKNKPALTSASTTSNGGFNAGMTGTAFT